MKKYLCEGCKKLQHESQFDVCIECIREWRSLQKVYARARERFPLLTVRTIGLAEAMAWILFKLTQNPEDRELAVQIREWTA